MAEPHAEVHPKRDGLLLVHAGCCDFLTWRESLALFVGWETPGSLARKRWPTPAVLIVKEPTDER